MVILGQRTNEEKGHLISVASVAWFGSVLARVGHEASRNRKIIKEEVVDITCKKSIFLVKPHERTNERASHETVGRWAHARIIRINKRNKSWRDKTRKKSETSKNFDLNRYGISECMQR